MDNTTAGQENTQLPPNRLEELRVKAKIARAETDRLWAELKAASELRRKYEEACARWAESNHAAEKLEAALSVLEAQ